MDEKIKIILKEYINEVEEVANILISSINDSENLHLKNKYDFFEYRSKCKKTEFEAGGINYRFHGKGCTAFSDEKFLDWDFGYRSRWCGIDPWKVYMTLKRNNSPHTEYYDAELIHKACEDSVKQGVMFKKYDQFYFEMTVDESFKPEFPPEYDTLIIEYYNLKWSIPRNKLINRFIRKSTQVYNQINWNEDKYMLRFLLAGEEIYAIPYNDVCYPENAVKIMSDEIIKNFLRKQ